jgi:tRNA pseudouridine55 synthase
MDLDGILLLDKDEGMTSFEAVRKVKKLLGAKKAGHSGTLDKSASGLLIVCLERATSVQNLFMSRFKRYRAILTLGQETDTLDRYGIVVKNEEIPILTEDRVGEVFRGFMGKTQQVPPLYSAIHQNGKRLYRRVLSGERPEVPPREVEIRELRLLKLEPGRISFEVLASKGTYIRSLGRDIAGALGSCGYLTYLRRFQIGPFRVEDAVRIEEIDEQVRILSLEEALSDLPQISLGSEKLMRVYNGVPPAVLLPEAQLQKLDPGLYRMVCQGMLVAIVEKDATLEYFRVFRNAMN